MNFNSPSIFNLETLQLPIDPITGNCPLNNSIIGKQVLFFLILDNTNEIADPINYKTNIISITGGTPLERFFLLTEGEIPLSFFNIINNGLGFISSDIVIQFNTLANYTTLIIYCR